MSARQSSALLVALLFFVNLLVPQNASADAKRRIAIMPFDYGAVEGVGGHDVGNGVVSLLITKLVNDGTYSVVERQALDAILKEQNLSVSDRADPATACKIGKLLSVDAIVVGTVTQFGFENRTTNVGAPIGIATSYIPIVGGFGGFGSGLTSHKQKAKVAIDARLVDINTSEILASVHGAGESKRASVSMWGSNAWDFASADFASSIAGEATMQAVDSIGSQINELAAKIPDSKSIAAANVQGKIADVTGSVITINVGKVNGLAVGDNLQVQRAYKTIKDPDTGKVLKELQNTIAIINLTQVDKDSATASIVKGSGAKVGDVVAKVTSDISTIVIVPASGDVTTVRTGNVTGKLLNQKTEASAPSKKTK